MDNWEMVSRSVTRNACVDTVVDTVPTTCIRTERGMFFTVAVSRSELPGICTHISELLLAKARPLAGLTQVGRFSDVNSWPLADGDPGLASFVRHTARQFSTLVVNFGHWPSFGEFLRAEIDYDVRIMPVDMQMPFEYWWLVGKVGVDRPVYKTNLYEDAGMFIRPDDNVLPVFTSSLYADMASQSYSQEYGLKLLPVRIPCLSCYLSGLGGFAGSEALKAALLNEQWRIRLVTCEEKTYSAPSHFYISDADGEEYALTGCRETENRPRWEVRRWGHDEHLFPKKCNPLPWDFTDSRGIKQ